MQWRSASSYLQLLAVLLIACCAFVVTPSKADQLMLMALPVGQGDCTVIVCPQADGPVIIVDLGSTKQAWTPDDVTNFLKKTVQNGDVPLYDRVTTIIITHGDKDHYNYVNDVFPKESFRLKVFLGGDKTDYKNGGPVVNSGKVFNKGNECYGRYCYDNGYTEDLCGDKVGAKFHIVAANLGATKNEKSVVLRVTYGSEQALLIGDLNGAATGQLISLGSKVDISATYYKISHHGASASYCNAQDLLDLIKPNFAFASAYYSGGNRYGHITCDVIDRLLHTPSTSKPSLDEATKHYIDCGKKPVKRKALTKAIWTTMPVSGSAGIIAINMNGDNSKPFIDVSTLRKRQKIGLRTSMDLKHAKSHYPNKPLHDLKTMRYRYFRNRLY